MTTVPVTCSHAVIIIGHAVIIIGGVLGERNRCSIFKSNLRKMFRFN
ncbi:hypothetical protein [Intestinibacter sp.]|nr:hypothetical protein [Intestinibacter sp.]